MESFEDNLIEQVRSYPTLYRSKSKKHRTLVAKDICWREIAKNLNKTPEECKNKWRHIRDNYRKNLNKKKTGNYVYASKYDDERLNFLNLEEGECSSSLNAIHFNEEDNLSIEFCSEPLQQPQEEEDSITSNQTQGTSQVKKKKRHSLAEELRRNIIQNREERTNILRHILEQENTPTHRFFKSMADVVCQFPPDKIAQIRRQVCDIVTEMELKVLKHRETPSQHSEH